MPTDQDVTQCAVPQDPDTADDAEATNSSHAVPSASMPVADLSSKAPDFKDLYFPVPPYLDTGNAQPLPPPMTIVITPEDCQDESDGLEGLDSCPAALVCKPEACDGMEDVGVSPDDDLPFGPPTPDSDDDEGDSDDSWGDDNDSEFAGADGATDDPEIAPSYAPCPAIPRTACKPLSHDDVAIYAFDCFEANNLKHPLANGVAVYREDDLVAFGCIVTGLGLYRVFLDRGCPIKVEHEEGRYSWLQCEETDRGLMADICSRLTSDRNMIFLDGDQEALRLARLFGLL